MQLTRAITALGTIAVIAAVACSDSGAVAPDAPLTTLGANGQGDSVNPPPPPPRGPTRPDTAGSIKPSSEPRLVGGTVVGMGPVSDSASYQKVAGATVIWLSSEGKELGRAVSAADGTFSLGSYKPGVYTYKVTPPAGGPFKSLEGDWAFIISEYSPATISLSVWLGRK